MRRQNDRAALLPYEDFLGAELKVLGQADGLTAIVHEDFRFALGVLQVRIIQPRADLTSVREKS